MRKAKVLLISPNLKGIQDGKNRIQPSLGLMLIAQKLLDDGHIVKIHDTALEGWNNKKLIDPGKKIISIGQTDEEIKLGKEEWLKKQKEKKLADKKLIKWALEESPEPIVKNPHLKKAIAAQQDAKQPKKIKPTEPVKIDFDLTPMHTASLMSNIRDSSIYKLLKNPKVIGVDLGHEGIMEAINILQSSGLLKKGGIVK